MNALRVNIGVVYFACSPQSFALRVYLLYSVGLIRMCFSPFVSAPSGAIVVLLALVLRKTPVRIVAKMLMRMAMLAAMVMLMMRMMMTNASVTVIVAAKFLRTTMAMVMAMALATMMAMLKNARVVITVTITATVATSVIVTTIMVTATVIRVPGQETAVPSTMPEALRLCAGTTDVASTGPRSTVCMAIGGCGTPPVPRSLATNWRSVDCCAAPASPRQR